MIYKNIWILLLGLGKDEKVYGTAADSNNNIYWGGYTLGGIDNNTSNGTQDGFLIKYNSDGDKQ